MTSEPPKSNRQLLYKYAGMAFQFMAAISAGVWLGWWLDGKLKTFPVLMIVLPLVIIISMLIQVTRDTGRKK